MRSFERYRKTIGAEDELDGRSIAAGAVSIEVSDAEALRALEVRGNTRKAATAAQDDFIN